MQRGRCRAVHRAPVTPPLPLYCLSCAVHSRAGPGAPRRSPVLPGVHTHIEGHREASSKAVRILILDARGKGAEGVHTGRDEEAGEGVEGGGDLVPSCVWGCQMP